MSRFGYWLTTDAPWKQSVLIGITAGVTLVVVLIAITVLTGNPQQRALDDITKATRAEVCVLALPVTEDGRDPADVERCLRENGL